MSHHATGPRRRGIVALATQPGVNAFEGWRGPSMGVARFGTTSDLAVLWFPARGDDLRAGLRITKRRLLPHG